ncbi:hypothetical protein Tco_0532215 [Tanacetum coccineum]
MTTLIITSTTDTQMHNIMAAGSRDRPPMLAMGRYTQWQSRFLRYIDTRPNGDALRKCILEAVETILTMSPENKAHYESEKEAIHLLLTGIGDEIYSTVDACKTAHDMWIAIERLQQVSSTTSTKMVKEVNEICAERIAKNANPLALVAAASLYPDPYYQAPKFHKVYAPTLKQPSSTRSNASTKFKGKEIAKPITPPSESTSKEDSTIMQKSDWGSLGNQRTCNNSGLRETHKAVRDDDTRIGSTLKLYGKDPRNGSLYRYSDDYDSWKIRIQRSLHLPGSIIVPARGKSFDSEFNDEENKLEMQFHPPIIPAPDFLQSRSRATVHDWSLLFNEPVKWKASGIVGSTGLEAKRRDVLDAEVKHSRYVELHRTSYESTSGTDYKQTRNVSAIMRMHMTQTVDEGPSFAVALMAPNLSITRWQTKQSSHMRYTPMIIKSLIMWITSVESGDCTGRNI